MNTAGLTALRLTNQVAGRVAPRATARRVARLFTTPRPRSMRPWEQEVEANAKRIDLATGLSALCWSGTGPSVLALHGWEGRATQFGLLAEQLRQHDANVLSLDGPAHGRSAGTRANPVAFARALLDADRECGPFDAVVGHSMGAASAGLAIAWGLRVDRVAMIAGPASLPGVLGRFVEFIGLPASAHRHFFAEAEAAAGISPEQVDVDRIAAGVQIPALIVHDRDDLEVPVGEGRRMAEVLADAEYVETAGLGHNRILRDPDVVARVASFLAG